MDNSYNLNNANDKKFIVYTASAGSGKTYSLSRFYIKLLLLSENPSYFRTIAALTFTNKAANEMKERIFDNLVVLSQDVNQLSDERERKQAKELLEDYSLYIGIPKEQIQEKSQKIVSNILHNYSDLTIQTIDKFTHKIIRPFSKDLNISPDFSIELGEDDIIAKSIDLLLQKSAGDKFLSKILIDFAYHKVEEGKRFQTFEKDIVDLANVFKKEDAIEFLKDYREFSVSFFFDKKHQLKERINALEKLLKSEGEKATSLFQSKGISSEDFYFSSKGVGVFFEKMAQGDFTVNVNSYILEALENNKWYTKQNSISAAIDSISKDLLKHLTVITKLLDEYNNVKFLYTRIFPTAVLSEIEKIIEDVKQSQNILTISDFNKLISELINSSHLSVPFLYERIGERYNHYLIDEFQDTSILQWNNLLPLIDDSLSKGNANLLVGDGKQAIYRFRNGDVEQFIKLPKLPHKPNSSYQFFENTLERNYQKNVLEKNYRSYSKIIEFNNYLFRSISNELNAYQKSIYEDVEQKHTDKIGGYVDVEFYEGKEFKESSLQYTLEAIHKATSCGYNLSDITILVRTRKEINEIAEFLISNNVEVVSEESLKLTYSKGVRALIEYLKLLSTPSDIMFGVQLIQTLNPLISSNELFEIISSKSVWKYLEDAYGIRQDNIQQSIFDAITFAEIAFLIDKEDNYFQQFKSFVWEKYKKDGISISDFVVLWKSLEDKEQIPSVKNSNASNAIQIITAHKSKGLQFKVVIIPFVNWDLDFKSTIKWISPEGIDGLGKLAVNITTNSLSKTPYKEVATEESEEAYLESLNILYVALTRAEEQMYLLVEKTKSIGKVVYNALSTASFYSEPTFFIGELRRFSNEKKDRISEGIKIKSSSKNHKVTLNIAQQADIYWSKTGDNEVDYGNLFHEIISKIKRINDAPKILKQIERDAKISIEQRQMLTSDIENMFKNELLLKVFGNPNRIFNEKEISYEGKQLRIDKLSLDSDGKIYLLDFKTGEPASTHQKQINEYKEALKKLNFNQIETFLYYTKNQQLLTV